LTSLNLPHPFNRTTSAVALIRGEQIVVANTGDTRVVLCHKGRAVVLTETHIASNQEEVAMVHARGGTITKDPWGIDRVSGILMLTRVLGPIKKRIPGLTFIPSVSNYNLSDDDCFVIIGSDGIFNVMSNQEVVDIVKFSETPQQAADHLVQKAYDEYNTDDNATAIVIRLKGWGRFRDVNYTQHLIQYNLQNLFGRKIEFPDCLVPLVTQNAPRQQFLRRLFEMFDRSNSGMVSLADMKEGMRYLGCLSSDDMDVLINALAQSKSLTFDEFAKSFS